MKYYSAIKRNKIGSFVAMWMDLQSVIQSKPSQRERENTCHVLTQTYMGSRKRVQINLFAGRHRRDMWTRGEEKGGMNWESGVDICSTTCKRGS